MRTTRTGSRSQPHSLYKKLDDRSALAYPESISNIPGGSREKRGLSQLTIYSTILAVSIAISLATGFLLWARVVYPNPTIANYGLPFSWRTIWNYSSQNATTDWSIGFFSFDVAFYASIGYILAFLYQRRYRTMKTDGPALGLSIAYVWLVLFISISLYSSYCNPVSRRVAEIPLPCLGFRCALIRQSDDDLYLRQFL